MDDGGKSAVLEFELGSMGAMCAGLHQRRYTGQIGNLHCLRCENKNVWVTALPGTSPDILKKKKKTEQEQGERNRRITMLVGTVDANLTV